MDFTDLIQLLHHMWSGALRFDPQIYDPSGMDDATRFVSVLIVILAGASVLIGQCFALFLVSASPIGFLLGLLFNGLSLAIRLGVWMAASVMVASLFFDTVLPPWNFISIIFIATSPLVFGFLAVLPSIGNVILFVLYGSTTLNMMYGMFYAAKVPFLSGALCALSGWVVMSLVERLFFSRSRAAHSGGFLFASRRLSRYSSEQIADYVKQRIMNR
ncbi:MAG: hypothetical protein MnENMB40S_01140 [Rhizobiaceae bacterium MnEN-MB40S]|nr:MAG: hypothetical protein MnENMB40S_01140 [Rhizobiaceae bacterium MnEN-MB40S]